MAYSKTLWVNDSTPALDAAHLNNIENGIEAVDVRITELEGSLTTASDNIETNTTDIETNTTAIGNLGATLNNAVVIKTGVFQGTWSPHLLNDFSVANYTDYNWSISLYQTSRQVASNDTVVLDGYLDVDGVTLRFTSSSNGTSVEAAYTLIGVKKAISSIDIINQ